MKCPDNYDAFIWHQNKMESELERLPICDECGERIVDEFCFHINGEYICESCMRDEYMVETPIEDY